VLFTAGSAFSSARSKGTSAGQYTVAPPQVFESADYVRLNLGAVELVLLVALVRDTVLLVVAFLVELLLTVPLVGTVVLRNCGALRDWAV